MKTTIQDGPAYRLSVDITETPYGVDLKFISFVPGARTPSEHTQLRLLLTHAELYTLQGAIETVIGRNAR
jgi:hypothetical protein